MERGHETRTWREKTHIIYLTTCGESLADVKDKFVRPARDVLTLSGETQAELLGKFLSRDKFTRLFCSDYPKALSSTSAIRRYLTENWDDGPKVKRDLCLRERGFEGLENTSRKKFKNYIKKMGLSHMTYDPEDCEKMKSVENRIHLFFMELFEKLDSSKHDQEVVLIVSHPYVLSKFIYILIGTPMYRTSGWRVFYSNEIQRNASFVKIAVTSVMRNSEDPDNFPIPRAVKFLSVPQTNHFEALVDPNLPEKYGKLSCKPEKLCFGCFEI